MTFADFAEAHGLVIRHIEFGKWCRTPTTDKPHHKNGAYKYMGEVGFCQNHATMTETAVWFPDADTKIDRAAIVKMKKTASDQLAQNRKLAARKAASILSECVYEQHAYLDSKGFPEMAGLVYRTGENNLLVIPMRIGNETVGCQLIDRDGGKKFLFGQRCNAAEYLFDGGGVDIFCEGYATGLSIRAVMAALKARCRIHVCFSAANMQTMAKAHGSGFVVADNDVSGTGERAAIATGLVYFLPPTIGQDFNDFHKAVGTFAASQAIGFFKLKALQDFKKKALHA